MQLLLCIEIILNKVTAHSLPSHKKKIFGKNINGGGQMIILNQKEMSLLKDQKKHEEICIEKYTNYANQTQDPELKQLFLSNAQQEQQHLDTLNQLLNGQMPNMGGQQQAGQQQNSQNTQTQNQPAPAQTNVQNAPANKNDAYLCEDLLSTEKYVSSTYNTAIFEFRDANVRNALNHIQKEEQEHGEKIYNYMASKGMYNA